MEIYRDIICIVSIVFLLTRCLHTKIYRIWTKQRHTTFGSVIWSKRKLTWRNFGVSKKSFIALALSSLKKVPSISTGENSLETHPAMYSESCAIMHKSHCDETVATTTSFVVLSRTQRRAHFCDNRCYTVKPLPRITRRRAVKKRTDFRRNSGNDCQRPCYCAKYCRVQDTHDK